MSEAPSREEGPADPVQGGARRPEPAADASRGIADRRWLARASGRGPEGSSSRVAAAGRGLRSGARGLASGARGLASGVGRLAGAGPIGLLVLALGIAALGVLIAAEIAPVYTIDVGGLPCDRVEFTLTDLCAPSGGDRHSYALILLGLLAAVMAAGAAIGGSRPAAVALALTGAAVLAIVLIGDLPDVNQTGEIGLRFDEAEANPASGFYLSLVGGALALAGGIVALLRR